MSDGLNLPIDPGHRPPAAPRGVRQRWRWQVSLRTLVLLMAAIAVWLTWSVNRRQNALLEARIQSMVPLAHELVVDDLRKIAVVKGEEYWMDDDQWEIFLPGGRYRLCLATRNVAEHGLAPVVSSKPITAGRHDLSLDQKRDGDGWRVTAGWDGRALLTVAEPKDWNPNRGASNDVRFAVSDQVPADRPVVLYRRRFMHETAKGVATTPAGPTEGILLWIERVATP
jgi:hypothetical protein